MYAGKMEAQRVALLQRRLAEQEKQTKMLMDRLNGRTGATTVARPGAGGAGNGASAHASGRRLGESDRKHRFEQALIDSANRAKSKMLSGETGKASTLSAQSARKEISQESCLSTAAKSGQLGPGGRSVGGASREHSREGDLTSRTGTCKSPSPSPQGSPRSAGDGYSKSAAIAGVERSNSELDALKKGKKGSKSSSKRDLPSILSRSHSGATEQDLETGLPVAKKSFSWMWAAAFVVLVVVLVYVCVIILQRYA
jgi:hypothetical protein